MSGAHSDLLAGVASVNVLHATSQGATLDHSQPLGHLCVDCELENGIPSVDEGNAPPFTEALVPLAQTCPC